MSSTDGPRQRRPVNQSPPSKLKQEALDEAEAVRKASGGWITSFIIAFFAALILSFGIFCVLPSPVEPVELRKLPDPPALVGPLEPNSILADSERIYRHHLSGPESIVLDGEYIYTGTSDGWVNVLHAGEVTKLVKFGKGPCGGIENEGTCGRPLGMRMGKDGLLLVLDAYYGLFKVNVVTGDYTTLYSSSTPINGKTPKLLNDLDIGPDGKIYFTDSSTRWNRNQFANIMFEGAGTGRLLMYDPSTEEVTQLFDGLLFANGVQMTKDKTAVLVAETCKARILKYNLKTKETSVWADNLPGLPDNIRYDKSSGTYWVGMAVIRHQGKFSMWDFLIDKPWLRGMIAKIIDTQTFVYIASKFKFTDTKAMAVEFNEAGQIIHSIQDKAGEVIQGVSEVESANGVLYFGSYHAPYIGRLSKRKIPAK